MAQMTDSQFREKKIYAIIFIVSVFLLLFLSGCKKEADSGSVPVKPDSSSDNDGIILPLEETDGDFHSAYGWLNDHTFIYVTESNEGAKVFAYDLKTGKSRLLHESEAAIVSLYISPGKKHLLVHSSPSTYKAAVFVLDLEGQEVFSAEIPSMDLAIEWNPHNEDLIAVAAFSETWEFTGHLINLQKKTVTALSLPQPFIHWMNDQEVLYLDWDPSGMEHFAPLKSFHLESGETETIMDEVYYTDAIGDDGYVLLLVRESSRATYSFYTRDLEKIGSFQIPQLSNFSDWLIPYFDYVAAEKRFLTFQPVREGEADLYNEKFLLVSYSINDDNMKDDVILENADNEPLSCSPNGTYCLYGFYLENLLDLQTKKIIPLLSENS